MKGLRIGTCSWNYDSWVGSVYSQKRSRAVEYLSEYSRRFDSVEIDSWFYKIPRASEALEYLRAVGEEFRFTCKVSEGICLTHARRRGASTGLEVNAGFLSTELFASYLEGIAPLLPRIDAIMLEFEYLSREKMKSPEAFMRALDGFASSAPAGLPLAVEVRNKNYLTKEYFQFLKSKGLFHVFSEKAYMPHVYEVYEEFGDQLAGVSVIRLLGGDRKEMELKADGRWDRIVEPKEDKARIADMTRKILYGGGKVIISVNNHYEGSAPLTIEYFLSELED
jgi:uncharacterized protein YecE (DUF72 family)